MASEHPQEFPLAIYSEVFWGRHSIPLHDDPSHDPRKDLHMYALKWFEQAQTGLSQSMLLKFNGLL